MVPIFIKVNLWYHSLFSVSKKFDRKMGTKSQVDNTFGAITIVTKELEKHAEGCTIHTFL